MKDGKAAMIINGDWSLGDYTTAIGDNLGVAPVPTINGKPYTEMTAGKYFMVSNAVLDDAAQSGCCHEVHHLHDLRRNSEEMA